MEQFGDGGPAEPAPVQVDPVGNEEHYWVAGSDGMASRAELRAGSGSYTSTIPPLIADYEPQIPSDLAADLDEASNALAAFDVYTRAVLGAQSTTLGPMRAVLLRTESASSSQIENLTVGARQLALAELDQSGSQNATVVVGNVRAMEAALDLADRLDEGAVLRMHEVLLSSQPGWMDQAGTCRAGLVWVGSSRVSPRGASHVGPQAQLVPALMRRLMAFVRRDDVPVLTQAAIAHAQFETIHPFADGNGRTGRALVHAILRGKNLLSHTTAPVSAGLLRETNAYFEALGTYRAGNARPILERFASPARFAASSGSGLVNDLAAALEDAREKLAGLRRQATAWQVLPHLVAHPVINAKYLTTNLGLNDVTAQRALTQLTERGVLEERTGRQRNRVWQHAGILNILDAYAQELHRGL